MQKHQKSLNWLILILVSVVMYFSHLDEPVKGRHSWANADHFAITLNFIDNGLNFFSPQTYCLNPKFSPKQNSNSDFWKFPQEELSGITAVDFPIHHYVVAVLMKLVNTQSTWVFRVYMMLLSILGLFYLGRTVFQLTHSFKWSVFIQLFVLLSPVYSFYSIAFLPSAASLAVLFIASFYMILYFKNQDQKAFSIGVLLLTLAGLTRFPFLIYLLAFVVYYFYRLLFFRELHIKNTLKILLGVLLIMLYFVYNKFYVFPKYGSDFLNHAMYPVSFQNVIYILRKTFYHESWRYFTIVHYLVLGYFIFLSIKSRLKGSIKDGKTAYMLITTLGVFLYIGLMLKQFIAHDYYALDTFFPILIFWMIAVYTTLPQYFFDRIALIILFSTALFFNKVVYHFGYQARLSDPLEMTIKNFKDADLTLAQLQIPSSSTFLLLDSRSPNLAFVGLKRKGFCVMYTTTENITRALTWDYDYILTQNFSFKEKILANYPSFNKETEVFYSNDKFTIHLKK